VNFELIKKAMKEIEFLPKNEMYLSLFLLLVGIHSLILGVFIFSFTEWFYSRFFFAQIDNFFFVRQAGLFLFCLGLFNIAIFKNIKQNRHLIKTVIATKCLAFIFLCTNAYLTPWPPIIYVAALGDGMMAVALFILFRRTSFATEIKASSMLGE